MNTLNTVCQESQKKISVNSVPPKIEKIYTDNVNLYLHNPKIQNGDIQRGRKILSTEDELIQYMTYYGRHHFYKLFNALKNLNLNNLENHEISVYDWGCGQCVGILTLLDIIGNYNLKIRIKKITLIEPSDASIQRGMKYISEVAKTYRSELPEIQKVCKCFDDLSDSNISTDQNQISLHFLSNILDVGSYNLIKFTDFIGRHCEGVNYFVCVGPKYIECINKIDYFYKSISRNFSTNKISESDTPIKASVFRYPANRFIPYDITRYEKVFVTDFRKAA